MTELNHEPHIISQGDVHDIPTRPTLSPTDILGTKFIIQRGEDNYRAEVVDKIDHELDKYLVKIGDSGREEILSYNDLIHTIEKQSKGDDPGSKVWIFKEIIKHCCNNKHNKVKVL